MTIIKRTCSTCAAFNPAPEHDDDPACLNLTSIIEQYRTPQEWHREPGPTDYCDSHQTTQEDELETREIEVARQLTEAAPEFMAAMSACLALVESLGEDHPDTVRAVRWAMSLAPPSLNSLMADKARELGLMPDSTGYTDDGEPVFSLESIAEKLDMSMEEAREAVDAMLAERAALGLPAVLIDPATIHRKH